MNFNSVRSVLKHNQNWVCVSCLIQCASTARWQRPFRRAASNKIILPAISPSAIAALHQDLDEADGVISKSDHRRAAKKARSKARLSSAKRKTTASKALKAVGKTKELGGGLDRKNLLVAVSEELPVQKETVDGKTKNTSGRSKTTDTARSPRSSNYSLIKPTAVKGEGKASNKTKNATGQSESTDTAGSPQSSNYSAPIKPQAVKAKGKVTPKKGVQDLTVTEVEGPGVKDENSTTASFGKENGTTNIEKARDVSRAKPFRKTTTKNADALTALRKQTLRTAFRRVITSAVISAPLTGPRRLTLKQRRQQALERRRKFVNEVSCSHIFSNSC